MAMEQKRIDDSNQEEAENLCPFDECDGSGEIDYDEVTPEGNVARGTLTRKCRCRLPDPDDYDEREED